MVASNYQRRENFGRTSRDIVSIFFYTRKTFVLSFVGVIVGALLVALLSTPVYKVSGRLIVKPRIEKPLSFDTGNSGMSLLEKVDQQTLNTVVYLLTSFEVVSDVVRKHGLADDGDEKDLLVQTAMMMGSLTAEPLSLSNIIAVEFKGENPEAITAQLNTLLDTYISYHIKVNQASSGSLSFFDQQAELYERKYLDLTDQLADTRKRLRLSNPALQANNSLNVIRDLEIRKARLVGGMRAAAQRIEQLKVAAKTVGREGLSGLPQVVRESYPAVVEMERSLTQLIINVQRARSDFQPGAKPVLDAELQYNNMKAQISDYIRDVIGGLLSEQQALQEEITSIDEQIGKSRTTLGQVSSDAVLLQRMEFELDLAKENYRLYAGKREGARISSEKDRSLFANVSVASRPQEPVSPWFPRRSLIMVASIPLALIVAIAASIIAYSTNQTVRNPADVHLRTRLRLLGTLDAV
ncbi:MAG: GumC family protein [Pontibacterium sp.]